MNTQGETIVPAEYDKIGAFQDGLALAVYRNQDTNFESFYQFVDNKGGVKIKLDTQYIEVRHFNEKRSIIRTREGYGCIDVNGDVVIEPQYAFMSNYLYGKAFFQTKDTILYGVVDTAGQILLAPSLTADEFHRFDLKTSLEKQPDGTFKRIDAE